jgi:hypothetical protein
MKMPIDIVGVIPVIITFKILYWGLVVGVMLAFSAIKLQQAS